MAGEIAFLCPPSLRSSVGELAPQFERATGLKVVIDWQLMPVMKRAIDAGAAFDVAILTPDLIDAAISQGAIQPQSHTMIARTCIGVAVRKGAVRPDISTSDAVRRTLTSAASIAYTGEGAAGEALLALIERLGLGPEVRGKLRPMPGGGAVEPVARGEVELSITTLPGILEVAGADLVGPLPPELQSWVVYVAGVGTRARDAATSAELIRFLTTPAAARVLTANGVEPAAP
jgi:molybdate transport system substrate-binding protein